MWLRCTVKRVRVGRVGDLRVSSPHRVLEYGRRSFVVLRHLSNNQQKGRYNSLTEEMGQILRNENKKGDGSGLRAKHAKMEVESVYIK